MNGVAGCQIHGKEQQANWFGNSLVTVLINGADRDACVSKTSVSRFAECAPALRLLKFI